MVDELSYKFKETKWSRSVLPKQAMDNNYTCGEYNRGYPTYDKTCMKDLGF